MLRQTNVAVVETSVATVAAAVVAAAATIVRVGVGVDAGAAAGRAVTTDHPQARSRMPLGQGAPQPITMHLATLLVILAILAMRAILRLGNECARSHR